MGDGSRGERPEAVCVEGFRRPRVDDDVAGEPVVRVALGPRHHVPNAGPPRRSRRPGGLDARRHAPLPGGYRYTMECLIASGCTHFKQQGCAAVSLSGAALARSGHG
jgi:hypothetical protein